MSVCRGICLFLSCSPPKSHLYGAQCEWCCALAECWFVYKWAGIGRGATAEFITNTKNDQRSENVIWKVQTIAAVDTAYCFQQLISVKVFACYEFCSSFHACWWNNKPTHWSSHIFLTLHLQSHHCWTPSVWCPSQLCSSGSKLFQFGCPALGFTLTLAHEF